MDECAKDRRQSIEERAVLNALYPQRSKMFTLKSIKPNIVLSFV